MQGDAVLQGQGNALELPRSSAHSRRRSLRHQPHSKEHPSMVTWRRAGATRGETDLQPSQSSEKQCFCTVYGSRSEHKGALTKTKMGFLTAIPLKTDREAYLQSHKSTGAAKLCGEVFSQWPTRRRRHVSLSAATYVYLSE